MVLGTDMEWGDFTVGTSHLDGRRAPGCPLFKSPANGENATRPDQREGPVWVESRNSNWDTTPLSCPEHGKSRCDPQAKGGHIPRRPVPCLTPRRCRPERFPHCFQCQTFAGGGFHD